MKTIRLAVIVAVSVTLGACTATNKSADSREIMPDTAGLQGEWRLDSYRIDCESTQFDASSNYKLSFNAPDNTFSLSTDCNLINGEFGITDDTIRFKNVLITEMACDNMIVEQNMLRLLNDSTAYTICLGDTLTFTAPCIGSAVFIKKCNEKSASAGQNFIGEYTDPTDGSTLQIGKSTNSGPSITISLFRLTDIDNGIGEISDDALIFTATDAAGNPIKGKITFDGDNATLVFTESTWGYLPDGTTYHFKRDSQSILQERTFLVGKTYSGGGNGGGLAIDLTIHFKTGSICECTSDFYQAFSSPITINGSYSVNHNGIVEVICRPDSFEAPIEWYFNVNEDNTRLFFNGSGPNDEGSIVNDWMTLNLK